MLLMCLACRSCEVESWLNVDVSIWYYLKLAVGCEVVVIVLSM